MYVFVVVFSCRELNKEEKKKKNSYCFVRQLHFYPDRLVCTQQGVQGYLAVSYCSASFVPG